jgi:hypothetical protein
MRIDASGNVGIGTTNLTGSALRISTTVTGATSGFGVMNSPTASSGVTASLANFHSAPATQAASFTLSSLTHFNASQPTIGAGSTVTNQYGFVAGAGLTGATNNYGFFSSLASGANRYNFYAAGTAANYMAGQLQLGDGTAATPALSNFGDENTGIYFPEADAIGFSVVGAEVMRVDSAGRLGVATNAPDAKLTVNGVASFAAGTALLPSIARAGDLNTGIFFPAADTIAFAEGGVEAMRIDSSGNVGINTTSPSAKLNVNGDLKVTAPTATPLASSLCVDFENGSGGRLLTYGSNTTTYIPIIFSQVYSNGNGYLERGRIDANGNLLLGTTDASKTSGVGLKLTPNAGGSGQFSCVGAATNNGNESYHLYSTGAGAYRFYVGYGGTVFATSTTISAISDIRYKENVRDLDVGLDKIMALKPRLFDWKQDKGANVKNARGFIAQEFEDVFPDLIDEWRDPAPEGEEPYKSVRADLIPVLVKAIQELKTLVDAQAARITALEAK